MALVRRTKRILAVVTALVALVLVGLGFAGNFLVDFALNPHAEVSMSHSIHEGNVGGLDYAEAPKLDEDYAEEAPNLEEVLNMMAGKFSDTDVAQMSYEVDVDKREPVDVARDWLIQKGLLEE